MCGSYINVLTEKYYMRDHYSEILLNKISIVTSKE
jgi:hypothetical protein